MIKKREHQRSIQISQHQTVGRFVPLVANKLEQQPETVAIGRDSLRTRITLTNQPFQKKILNELGELAFRGRG